MNKIKYLLLAGLCFIVTSGLTGSAESETASSDKKTSRPDPADFDKNKDGVIDIDELRAYVVQYYDLRPDVRQYVTDDLTFKPDAQARLNDDLRRQADIKAGAIIGQLALDDKPLLPIPIERLQLWESNAYASQSEQSIVIAGVFEESAHIPGGSIGPLLLRKTADEWDKDPKNTQGARLSYSDNRESSESSWSSDGALIYPISLSRDYSAMGRNLRVRSISWLLIPGVSWKENKVRQTDKDDVEELQWQVPVVWSANHAGLGWLRNTELSLSPYLLTDFDFKGMIWGSTLNYQPYILDDKSGLGVNTGYKGLASSPLMYRLGAILSLDFNHLSSASIYITRNHHDDYLRAGGKAEVGLITHGYPALEAIASYQAFYGLDGAPSHSEFSSISGKFWLNKYVGVSVEYERGNTPVAQKDIDLVTVGLECKF